MKPVQLKITLDHLTILNEELATLQEPSFAMEAKVAKSIGDQLSRKLLRKQISRLDKPKKDFKLSLELYEAFYLMNVCKMAYATSKEVYATNVFLKYYHAINQLLS